jgi:hypothetical protein
VRTNTIALEPVAGGLKTPTSQQLTTTAKQASGPTEFAQHRPLQARNPPSAVKSRARRTHHQSQSRALCTPTPCRPEHGAHHRRATSSGEGGDAAGPSEHQRSWGPSLPRRCGKRRKRRRVCPRHVDISTGPPRARGMLRGTSVSASPRPGRNGGTAKTVANQLGNTAKQLPRRSQGKAEREVPQRQRPITGERREQGGVLRRHGKPGPNGDVRGAKGWCCRRRRRRAQPSTNVALPPGGAARNHNEPTQKFLATESIVGRKGVRGQRRGSAALLKFRHLRAGWALELQCG